ncbi:MAG: CFI-box-CTERM domain-containing protein [Christensenellales bacterium]
MDYITVTCENCSSEYRIPLDIGMLQKETLQCMACSREINIRSIVEAAMATGSNQELFTQANALIRKMEDSFSAGDASYMQYAEDVARQIPDYYKAHYYLAISRLNEKMFMISNLAEKFARQQYGRSFEIYRHILTPMLANFKRAYNSCTEDRDALIKEFGEKAAAFAIALRNEKRASMKRSDTQLFEFQFVQVIVAFFIPAILAYDEPFGHPLADAILAAWNKEHPKSQLGKAEYEQIAKGFKFKLCFITTAACEYAGKEDDCAELTALRHFRDDWLAVQSDGPTLINHYYLLAPLMVEKLQHRDDRDALYNAIWQDYLTPCLQLIERGENHTCKEHYTHMMNDLSQMLF